MLGLKNMSFRKYRWTHDQSKRLRQLTTEAVPPEQIAKELGKSHHAVISKQNRLGIYKKTRSVRYYTELEIKEILHMIKLGLNDKEIAAKVNRNVLAITKLVEKLKSGYLHPAIWSQSEIEVLKELVANNAPWNEITNKLGRSNGEITRKRKELGLFRRRKHAVIYDNIDKTIIKMLQEGKHIEEIGEKCNRGNSFIFERCKYLGITNDFSQLKDLCISANEIRLEKRFTQTLISIKNRSKRTNRYFSLNIHDLIRLWEKQGGKCFYSNSNLTLEKGKDNTFSIDRIDPSKGYIIENICFCRYDINWMKMDKTSEEFIDLLRQTYEFQLSKNKFL